MQNLQVDLIITFKNLNRTKLVDQMITFLYTELYLINPLHFICSNFVKSLRSIAFLFYRKLYRNNFTCIMITSDFVFTCLLNLCYNHFINYYGGYREHQSKSYVITSDFVFTFFKLMF